MLHKYFGPGWPGHLLALVAGALITLSLAPFGYWPLSLLSLALLNGLLDSLTPRQAAMRGWCFGVGLFGTGISWIYVSIHDFGAASVPLAAGLTGAFALALAVMHAGLGYGYARWVRPLCGGRSAGFAAWWVLWEWVRLWLLTGFPWLYVGYAHLSTPLAGWAPVAGVFGISLIVALSAAALAQAALRRRVRTALIVSASAWVSGAVLQHIDWTQPQGEPVRVAMVQADIPQLMKWDQAQYQATLDLYRTLSAPLWERARIVIWPEAAITNLYANAREFLDAEAAQAARNGSTLITGIPTNEPEHGVYFNSAVALDGEHVNFYHKRHLVPFGEYVPLEKQLRGIIQFFDLPMSDFAAGPMQQPALSAGGLNFALSICYEIVYPDLARAQPTSGALLTLSNDAWFGHSIGPLQHLQMAQMRALENRRPLLRATGNGVTALVDARGQIADRLPQFEQAVLIGSFQPMQGLTPFGRTGSWPALLICGLILLALVTISLRQPQP